MTRHASGPFDVKLTPQAPEAGAVEGAPGRMALDKRFHGDLDATSQGQMLAVHGAVKGSAGYVALERVSGTLHGRQGTFALQHFGLMTRGTPHLEVKVVPDSGTGELTGLEGTLDILIDATGKHTYDLQYTLPDAP